MLTRTPEPPARPIMRPAQALQPRSPTPYVSPHRPPYGVGPSGKTSLYVRGMQGLGDNLHQRGWLRQLLPRYDITLESSWFSLYHDLIPQGLRVIAKRNVGLRTQHKNVVREAHLFHPPMVVRNPDVLQVWYRGEDIRRLGSFLAAMCHTVGRGVSPAEANFTLPIPEEWYDSVQPFLERLDPRKPIMFYRPLVERTEWPCKTRNPDFESYYQLINSIRHRYSVVSVADLEERREWLVGRPIEADLTLHRGELTFEQLAALASLSSLVFCSPGNALVLAQAVGTPVVCVFGGHEASCAYKIGSTFWPTPFLGIDPIRPCQCFLHHHSCDKRIDVTTAIKQLKEFCDAVTDS